MTTRKHLGNSGKSKGKLVNCSAKEACPLGGSEKNHINGSETPTDLADKIANLVEEQNGITAADVDSIQPLPHYSSEEKASFENLLAERLGYGEYGVLTSSAAESEEDSSHHPNFEPTLEDIDYVLDEDTDMGETFETVELVEDEAEKMSAKEVDALAERVAYNVPSVKEESENSYFAKNFYNSLKEIADRKRAENSDEDPFVEINGVKARKGSIAEAMLNHKPDWKTPASDEISGYKQAKNSGASLFSSSWHKDEEGQDVLEIHSNTAKLSLPVDEKTGNTILSQESDVAVATAPDESKGKVVAKPLGENGNGPFSAVYVDAEGNETKLSKSRNLETLMKKIEPKLNPRNASSKAMEKVDIDYRDTLRTASTNLAINAEVESEVTAFNAYDGAKGNLTEDQINDLREKYRNTGDGTGAPVSEQRRSGFIREALFKKDQEKRYRQPDSSYWDKYGNKNKVAHHDITNVSVAADQKGYVSTHRLIAGGGKMELQEEHSIEGSVKENGVHNRNYSTANSPYARSKGLAYPESAGKRGGPMIPKKEADYTRSYKLTVPHNNTTVTTSPAGKASFFAEDYEMLPAVASVYQKDSALANEVVEHISSQRNGWGRENSTAGSYHQGTGISGLKKRLQASVLDEEIPIVERPSGWRTNSEAANEERHMANAAISTRNSASEKAKELIERLDQLSK